MDFVTSRCYKSHELAQASLLWGTVVQVSDVAHGSLKSIDIFDRISCLVVKAHFYFIIDEKPQVHQCIDGSIAISEL